MVDPSTADAMRRTLHGLGIDLQGEPTDGSRVTLCRGQSQQVYTVTVPPQEMSNAVRVARDGVRVSNSERQFWILDYARTPLVVEMEKAGIDYVDAAGNVGIEFGDVIVRVRGQRAPVRPPSHAEGSRSSKGRPQVTNLFSRTRSQVLFALLTWPHLLNATVREIADAAGTSQGSAHLTTELLLELEHTVKTTQGTRWRDWSRTADGWLATYPTTLGKSLSLATLSGNLDRPQKVNAEDPVFLSGESAFSPDQETRLDYVDSSIRPSTLTLYVRPYDSQLAVKNRWRADGPPNIFIRDKFWRAPDHSDGPLGGFRSAPALLVIADLLSTSEPRQVAAAKDLLGVQRARHS
ncbi:hypothetical protein K0651_10290 [Ornithinimicrobium sp. Arc0846-15]|nr:hypothetical protein [Ornithinimicrobium laminariae]